MLRKYLIASTSGLAMLAMTADSAMADPISASIVAAIGLTGLTASVATAAITAVISIGLSYAANALFAPPAPPGGAQLDIQTGGALPRSVTFGKAVSAGALVYWNAYGKKNKFLQLVYRLGDWEFESLDAVWVDGKRRTLTSVTIPGSNNEAARYTVQDFDSNFVIRWFAGTTTQLADTELVDNANPTGRWTTSHRGRGVCYVSLTLTFNDNKFPGGLPALLFEYKGAKLYDRRLDTTAGGSGLHRWNDPSTWEWSQNPGVCAENFLRGFYRSGERVHGWGLPEAAISTADLVSAMNLSDEALTEGGSSVVRYTCSVISSEGNEQRQALSAFVEAMGGYFFEAGGVIYVKGGGSETAVATLSESDLTADGEYEFIEKQGRAQLVNRISGTFTDPENGWQAVDYPEITSASWVTEDNGEDLGLDYNLPSVTSGYQAERIAKIRANMARLQKRLNIEVLEKHLAISAGDWLNYSDDTVGAGIQWLVAGVTEQPDRGTLRLELQEVDADAFEGATLFAPIVVDAPEIDAGATTIAGLAATGVKLDQGNGEVPSIRLTWTPPEDDTITGVRFEYNIDAVGAVVQQVQMANPESGEFYITDGLAQDTDYLVRATIITDPVRAVTWTDYESATTPVITVTVDLVNRVPFTTPGGPYTWTKAANPAIDPDNAFVIIESIGGGGAGGRGNNAAGGGGGAYSRDEYIYSDLPASLDVYVAAGGIGPGAGGGAANPDDITGRGGLSYVVNTADATDVYSAAYGGGPGEGNGSGGDDTKGGGGGGLLGYGQPGRAGSPAGGGGAGGGGSNLSEGNITPPTEGGGGAGNLGNGGAAIRGGGGGARGASNGSASTLSGGKSRMSGDGGSSVSGVGGNGNAPGGGGAGSIDSNAPGDGARGEVRITIVG